VVIKKKCISKYIEAFVFLSSVANYPEKKKHLTMIVFYAMCK